ncbi:SGNH/GDSL hydrolase family protein [Pontibacter toksunensis]|uniref:SGNH/GDSL hydrolase family protein n=1 Tax=Pontibacter toksunensis TaxID=1332631 RepID=A0ABW6BTC0_9BACT
MKSANIISLLLLLTLCCFSAAQAQENNPPFWNEIQEFKQQDSVQMPPKDAILFVGSSSFRMWENMQEMFPSREVINRGFGGSNLLDLKHYLNDIVLPYQPKQIVIYSGENDIAPGTVHAQEVLTRFQDVFESIRKEMPQVQISFVSIKPSPSRWQHKATMEEANRLIRAYLKTQPRTSFINVYPLMLDRNRKPKSDIFLQDSLHMNNNGYQIWQKAISPYLLK